MQSVLVDGPVAHVSESIRTLGFFRRKTGGVPSTLLIKRHQVQGCQENVNTQTESSSLRMNCSPAATHSAQVQVLVQYISVLRRMHFSIHFLWLLDLALLNCEV